ncbi:hypothetical protein STCU_11464 [Strigomonas culicis]|uniref:Uncharacterized protein n=1 Tax=Strigomonas culicis TaxID=28005 RepID=S9TH35_9TRYP|nr:hypothetical protein STCU_11464 [Strigomonas culicis]|eukprot:EPY16224.1 hypothetical protein STCU_11464 [Strigomonas culicis]
MSQLVVNTELIERLIEEQKRFRDSSNGEGARESFTELFVHSCPPMADPAWAMEELRRAAPGVPVGAWGGSVLPPHVWSPPGTQTCTFGTQPCDFVHGS